MAVETRSKTNSKPIIDDVNDSISDDCSVRLKSRSKDKGKQSTTKSPLMQGSSALGTASKAGSSPAKGGDIVFSFTLGFMYASFIACRQFFSSTQAAIVEDPLMNMDNNRCANIVVVAGIGFGIAKVITGLLVDKFDAIIVTYVFMLATCFIVMSYSFADSYETMLILGFLNSVPQAGGYPALNKIVYDTLQPEQYGQAIAAISIGSRIGASASFLIFGACLNYFTWRQTIQIAPLLVLAAIVLSGPVLLNRRKSIGSTAVGTKTPSKKDNEESPKQRSTIEKLAWVASDGQFWRVSIASACLLVSKGFEAIAPLYISGVLKLSASASAMLVSAIPAGLVVSVLWGASYVDKLEQQKKGNFIVYLTVMNSITSSIICGLTWYLETGGEIEKWLAVVICMLLFFSLGFSTGYCFYVPQSIYAIEFGGADSGTVVGCSELIQAVVGAVSLKMAGSVSVLYGWRYVWALITGFGVMAAVSMSSFQSRKAAKEKAA